MQVVAFLQNVWLLPRSLERFSALLASPNREEYLRRLLFYRSRTGKALERAGFDSEAVCWEEATREIGTVAGAKFPPQPEHMAEVLNRHRPSLVITFGSVAATGLIRAAPFLTGEHRFTSMGGPHPTARGIDVMPRLKEIAEAAQGVLR